MILAALLWLASLGPAAAQQTTEQILPLDGRTAPDGTSIDLLWFDAQPPRVGSVTVKRRLHGQTGGESWKSIAPALGPVMRYTDDSVVPGVAYEYQVLRIARDIVDVGYWLAGVNIPAQETRGTAHLVIDATLAEDLSARLDRFAADLTGDGWRVQRHSVPRGQPGHSMAQARQAAEIREMLRRAYSEDPFGDHAAILIGHVPVVLSGRANPDGHDPSPHPTDLFYADMDGRWQANTEGLMLHNRLPDDFIEMQIGRIDFANLADGDKARELRFLRAYFDKNHHWRHGLLGDLRMAYGGTHHLTVDRAGLRNIVGPAAVREGHHHGIGEQQPWLWGVDFGDHNPTNYFEKYANRAVFTLNFGSGKQKFHLSGNTMTALLAQPWYTIATGWGGRPSWWLHHMALGASVGTVHKRTVNNGRAAAPYQQTMDHFPTGTYMWRNPVWVNLLGDPTTQGFPLTPPAAFTAQSTEQGVRLSWAASPDTDTTGYKLYRAEAGEARFAPLADGALLEDLSFTDTAPVDGARYMLRAYGLKQVYAGSIYRLSQGVFATAGESGQSAPPPQMTLTTPVDQSIALPEVFNTVTDGDIHAIITGPKVGRLAQEEGRWVYIPPAGFSGQIDLPISRSGQNPTAKGRLRITVRD